VKVYKVPGSTNDNETLKKRASLHIQRSWYPEGTNRQIAAVFIDDYCDRRAQLAKISTPTMVIQGDAAPLVSVESGREVASAVPNAELVIIPGMGHDILLKFVSEIARQIVKNVGKAHQEIIIQNPLVSLILILQRSYFSKG
jgi:pimeloyl-ACP methyl ester carboxylesterase